MKDGKDLPSHHRLEISENRPEWLARMLVPSDILLGSFMEAHSRQQNEMQDVI